MNRAETLAQTATLLVSSDEVVIKKVVRAGKIQRKVVCKPGFKAVDGKCVRMSSQEKTKRAKGAKIAARKSKSKKAQTSRKRAKSMSRRGGI